ncbi:J domain-containing protein [Cyanobium sp. WAJ14-Wanaka]|uniref:J domain-containing protein n=1 Tax=Cyanobium sp. WAJ14-Wanaka TaxID=2823725 RepID=UPI0020CE0B78|nr:J domain-containing protein [Cyanobium sp. WAJ14-Wanaka]
MGYGDDLPRIPQHGSAVLLGPPPFRPNYYALLEVSPQASADQLHQAFRALSKRYHPDTTALPADRAARAFQNLQEAYGVLGDPGARQLYDSQLQTQMGVQLPPPNGSGPAPVVFADQRRPLSGGEWLALLLLGLTLLFSLALGIGLAWLRGER